MNRAFLENFNNFEDAVVYLERYLGEKLPEEVILEASIRYINNHWVSGVMFGKAQQELDFD